MRNVTDQLRQQVHQSHSRRYEVSVTVPDGDTTTLTTVVAGEVSFDLSRSAGLRAGQITVVGEEAIPYTDTHPLSPFGQYATVAFLYDLPTGTERVEVGEFPLIGTTVTRPEKLVSVTLGDWAYRVDRASLERAQQWAASAEVADVIAQLIADALGFTVTLTSDLAGETIGGEGFIGNAGDSPWRLILALGDAHDRYIYFASRTEVVITSRLGVGTPVDEVATGTGGTIVRSTSDITVTTAYNRIIVIVESAAGDAPTYRAVRTLTDGPLAYDRTGFGIYPMVAHYRVENATQALANSYADYLFARQAGAARSFDLTTIPMPWLEAGDTIMLTSANGSEACVIESMSLPFEAETPSRMTTRADRTQEPGPYAHRTPALMRGA